MHTSTAENSCHQPKQDEAKKANLVPRCSLQVIDSKVDVKTYVKSCFSDEDSKSEEVNSEDILKLAEKQDKLKASRNDLVQIITSRGNLPSPARERCSSILISPKKKDKRGTLSQILYAPPVGSRDIGPKQFKEIPSQAEEEEEEEETRKENIEVVLEESPRADNLYCCHSVFSDEENDEGIGKKIQVFNAPRAMGALSKSRTKEFGGSNVQKVPEIKFVNPFRSKTVEPGRLKKLVLPTLEGYLKKKSTSLLKVWQKRYFVLKDKKLYYYQNQSKDLMSGCVDFDLLSVKLEKDKDEKHFKITPTGGQRYFYFKAQTEEEGKRWFEMIESHIKASFGYVTPLNKVVTFKKYWKYDRLSEDRFLEQADTGDIVLFKTKNISASIQRSFTRSEYDHVGLILRYSTGEIVLFEATGREGVGLCRWKTFMRCKWHLLYSKIMYRKLEINRTDDVINGIEKFVRYSVGKKYKITPTKLLKRKSTVKEDENVEDRTFFCSELVAACYKKIGLLPQEVSAAQYLPGSFAAEKKLTLNNAKLGSETLIDFNI